MRDGHASRTAEHNALFRALESALPESRRLFRDPLARAFLTWPFAVVTWLAVVPGLRELVPWRTHRAARHSWCGIRLPGLPLAGLVRHHGLRSRPSRYPNRQTEGTWTRPLRPAEARSVRWHRLQSARAGVRHARGRLPRGGAHVHSLGRRNELPDRSRCRYHPAVVRGRVAR